MTNRAAADFDNIIVSASPFSTIYADDFDGAAPGGGWHINWQWNRVGGVYGHTYTGGYARALTGAFTQDQIVEARVRATNFSVPESWVGLLARYQDDYNHLYVSWQGRGVISLWRRTNGAITQLATMRLAVTPGRWYTLRVEVVDNRTRVFVDGTQLLSSNADPGPDNPWGVAKRGRVGLITYKAAADYDDFVAYQP